MYPLYPPPAPTIATKERAEKIAAITSSIGAAAALLAFFFAPAISFGGFISATGVQIAMSTTDNAQSLWIIPGGAVLALLASLIGLIAERARFDGILSGLTLFIVGLGEIFFMFLTAKNADALQVLDSGFWALALGMAAVAIGGLIEMVASFL